MSSHKSLFLFHRDFRIEDNIAFRHCYKESSDLACVFIFTPEQTTKNPYFSPLSFDFLKSSLEELNKSLLQNMGSPLYVFQGTTIDVLKKIHKQYPFDAIYYNQDYTLYAKKRDSDIKRWVPEESPHVSVFSFEDYLLKPIGTFLKKDGTPYKVYTPFMKEVQKTTMDSPFYLSFSKKYKKKKTLYACSTPNMMKSKHSKGGRQQALSILEHLSDFKEYKEKRDEMAYTTTGLSPYIKYGCVSIREVYHAIQTKLGKNHALLQQIIWREFYYYLAYYFPYVLEGKSMKEKYDSIPWENNSKIIEAWCTGTTGFPIVDACMRQLNQTGMMHNRGRLITSAVLIKILDVDWRIGEKYFAQHLIDYDPIVNNGNWQWASGSGADSQPYFRIFNPWTQTLHYDPQCEFIKQWIPELEHVPVRDILNWEISSKKINSSYPSPIVDYKTQRNKTLKKYKSYLYT
jgi:deoxyribodipyrimidine photo-lyase